MSQGEAPLGLIQGRGCAVRRAADGMLRALGATQMTLRLANPSSGDTRSQLGLEPPPAEDVQIVPALIESLAPQANGKRRYEIIVSAKALHPVAESHGVVDIPTWLLQAQGILHDNRLLRVDSVRVDRFAGLEYLYHITATE